MFGLAGRPAARTGWIGPQSPHSNTYPIAIISSMCFNMGKTIVVGLCRSVEEIGFHDVPGDPNAVTSAKIAIKPRVSSFLRADQ